MQHAWGGYAKHGWGKNEVRPVSLRGHTASIFGSTSMGATVVDALDTLYIMGMKDEFEKAREWVVENLDFNRMVSLKTLRIYFQCIFLIAKPFISIIKGGIFFLICS